MKLRFAWNPLVTQSLVVGAIVLAEFQTSVWTTHWMLGFTLDRTFLLFALFAATNFAVVFAGDRRARKMGWWKRFPYLVIGALGSTAAHAVALAPGAYVEAWRNGTVLVIALVPVLIGAATGFLLHRRLGYCDEGDNPAALAALVSTPDPAPAGAVHDIGTAAYYDGPLQVRSSPMAALVAAVSGSTLYSLTVMFSLSDGLLPPDAMPPLFHANPAMMTLVAIAFYTLPFLLFVNRSHSFLQVRGKDQMLSYALAGVVVPLGFALMLLALMGPFGVMIVLPWVLPSVVAMTVYHRLAGFEPLALPQDIEVRDARTMLPADHVRRRVRRAVPVN